MTRSVLSLLGLAVVIAYGFGIWLFLLHADDPLPAKADAVAVLAGSDARLPLALDLVRHGVAKTLVVSTDDRSNDPARYALCHGAAPTGYKLVCATAAPFSTQGEAELIGRLAAKDRWHSIVVVSSRYHLYRASVLIRRCTNVAVAMRGSDTDSWWRKAVAVPLEYAKLIRAVTLKRGC